MTFWNWEQRSAALTPPPYMKSRYAARRAWLLKQREELGFQADEYGAVFVFYRRKLKGQFEWAVEDRRLFVAWLAETKNMRPDRSERESLQWQADHNSVGVVADGFAATVDECWAAACMAVGSDRLEIGHCGWLSERHKAASQLREYDRIAALDPQETTSQRQTYVYAIEDADFDHYVSDEYRRHCERFCFRRYRIVKETKRLLFVDHRNYEMVDRDGVVAKPRAGRTYCSGLSDSRSQLRKAIWSMPDDYDFLTASRWVKLGRRETRIYLSLDVAAAEHAEKRAQFVEGWGQVEVFAEWAQTLELHTYEGELHSMSREELQGFYRRAVLKAHPDHGGTTEQFQAVQAAYAQAKQVLV